MVDLLAVGELMLDLAAPALEPGRAVHAPIRLRAGGTPANAARAAAALGARVAVAGRVGDDAAARLLREELAGAGIEPHLAVDPDLPTGVFLEAGTAIAADRGASARLSAADVPRLDARAVLVSAYTPVRVETRAELVASPDGNVVFLNAAEARVRTGLDPDDALARLAAEHRLACVTLGADGAVAALDGVVARSAPPERLPAHPTGAGDALAGAVLVSLVRGATLADALAAGCRAAVSVQAPARTPGRAGSASAGS